MPTFLVNRDTILGLQSNGNTAPGLAKAFCRRNARSVYCHSESGWTQSGDAAHTNCCNKLVENANYATRPTTESSRLHIFSIILRFSEAGKASFVSFLHTSDDFFLPAHLSSFLSSEKEMLDGQHLCIDGQHLGLRSNAKAALVWRIEGNAYSRWSRGSGSIWIHASHIMYLIGNRRVS